MQAARAKVLAATRASKIFFLNTVTPDNVVDMIKEGVMIGAGGQRAAEIGRAFSKRTMPW
jgi:ABC-type sugar transport system substrate-binding protein